MKKEYKKFAALPISALLACTLISGCSINNEKTEADDDNTIVETDAQTQEQNRELEAYPVPAAFLYMDYAQEKDGILNLNLTLYCSEGSFSEDFGTDLLEFGGDLTDAYDIEISEMNEQRTKASLFLKIEQGSLDADSLNLEAALNVLSGAMINEDGIACEDRLVETKLTIRDEDKNLNKVGIYLYPDTNTMVYLFNESKIEYGDIEYPYLDAQDLIDLEYLIMDFTKVTSIDSDAIIELQNVFGLSNPQLIAMNPGEDTDYYTDLISAAGLYCPNFQFVYGDNSLIDTKSKSVYNDLKNYISKGILEVDYSANLIG
jgi:hypothetical protein